MKYKCLPLLFTLMFAQSQPVFAQSPSTPPKACPSINAIVALGLNNAEVSMIGWIASNSSQYNTPQTWYFGLFVPAYNKEEAIKVGKENIKKLSQFDGPKYYKDIDDRWGCVYADAETSIIGVAFTPLITNNFSSASLMLLRKS